MSEVNGTSRSFSRVHSENNVEGSTTHIVYPVIIFPVISTKGVIIFTFSIVLSAFQPRSFDCYFLSGQISGLTDEFSHSTGSLKSHFILEYFWKVKTKRQFQIARGHLWDHSRKLNDFLNQNYNSGIGIIRTNIHASIIRVPI